MGMAWEIYTYPDLEQIICTHLPTILTNLGLDSDEFRVATKKLKDSTIAPPIEIIVRSDGGDTENKLKTEAFTIYVWVTRSSENEAYAEANYLIELLAGAIDMLRKYDSNVKFLQHGFTSPVEDEGKTQVRQLTSEALVLANKTEYNH